MFAVYCVCVTLELDTKNRKRAASYIAWIMLMSAHGCSSREKANRKKSRFLIILILLDCFIFLIVFVIFLFFTWFFRNYFCDFLFLLVIFWFFLVCTTTCTTRFFRVLYPSTRIVNKFHWLTEFWDMWDHVYFIFIGQDTAIVRIASHMKETWPNPSFQLTSEHNVLTEKLDLNIR